MSSSLGVGYLIEKIFYRPRTPFEAAIYNLSVFAEGMPSIRRGQLLGDVGDILVTYAPPKLAFYPPKHLQNTLKMP